MRRMRRGAAVVEFALTLPFLVYVMVSIVELGLLMHRGRVVARAARDGCRIGAPISEGPNPTGDLIIAAAEEHARFLLTASGVDCTIPSQCIARGRWHEVDGWHVLTLDVLVPYTPFTRLVPWLPTETAATFTMLTQQQVFDGA